MNGCVGFRKSSLIRWWLHVSYHVEEFDDTARYHNHPDEASSIKWLSLHDGSVPAAKLITASKEEPSKEIKCFFFAKGELSYSLILAPSDTQGFVFIGKGRISCGGKQTEVNKLITMITPWVADKSYTIAQCNLNATSNKQTNKQTNKKTNKQQNISRSYDVIFAVSFLSNDHI